MRKIWKNAKIEITTTDSKFILVTRENLIWLVQTVTNMYDVEQGRDKKSRSPLNSEEMSWFGSCSLQPERAPLVGVVNGKLTLVYKNVLQQHAVLL